METINIIGERLKHLRTNILELNQKDFSEKLNIGADMISRYEKGQRNLTDRTISDICREFNVNENWLRHGEGAIFVEHSSENIDMIAKEYDLSSQDKLFFQNFLMLEQEERDYMHSIFQKLYSFPKVMDTFNDEVEQQLAVLDQYEIEDLTEKKKNK